MPDPDAVTALRRGPVADRIRSRRLIAVLRRISPRDRLHDVVASLAVDGVRIFEITFDTPDAGDDLVAVRDRLDATGTDGAVVGAGTILTLNALEDAARCAAAFVVGPTLDLAIVERAIELRIPVVPGAYTPTEIALAWRSGATFVKVFPASSLAPDHVRELRGPLPDIELIATGGVDRTNAREFLTAGCVAVGVGGALVNGSPDDRAAIIAASAP